jgi:hypothetical protein
MPGSASATRRRRRHRQRLLDVVHEAFVENGVTASMDDIARRAGVGSGTPGAPRSCETPKNVARSDPMSLQTTPSI